MPTGTPASRSCLLPYELCRLFEQSDPRGRFASVVMITLKGER
jgi:hypothetical protein